MMSEYPAVADQDLHTLRSYHCEYAELFDHGCRVITRTNLKIKHFSIFSMIFHNLVDDD